MISSLTPVVCEAVLFAGFVSVSVVVTEAELVIEAVTLELTPTTIVMVALAPTFNVPSAPVIVPAALVAVPWLALADTNVKPAGKTSVTVTFVALDGPLLVTVNV